MPRKKIIAVIGGAGYIGSHMGAHAVGAGLFTGGL
jgi:UDP-glucose 4-epimerase